MNAVLTNCSALVAEVSGTAEVLLRLRSRLLFSSTSRLSHVPRADHRVDQLSYSIAEIDEVEQIYVGLLSKLFVAVLAVERLLISLADPRYRQLLRYRYILGYTWERIGVVMFADERQCRRWHFAALKMLGEVAL
jgi:DNA-directed RNA polymerase specialized sigma24 family protein